MNSLENRKQDFLTDNAVRSQEEDRFQRYGYAKRIAETLKSRRNKEGFVISIHGAWGTGKSSVLNFIEEELESSKDILRIHFNPWRYQHEDELNFNLFLQITESLERRIQSNKERFGEYLKDFGDITKFFGFGGLSGIGETLSERNLTTLKRRVDEFLIESEHRLVIFVDDIDRLDKDEVYALFRLIKLNADFTKTTYILSFDRNMVSAALGERFGEGSLDSGRSFLEKIIQVPLELPMPPLGAMQQYAFDQINLVLNECQMKFSQDEVERFVTQFTSNILPRLSSPRLAVRYANSLAFSIPILKGEVNTVDLMLIEALKIFYPQHYELVVSNPNLFTASLDVIPKESNRLKKMKPLFRKCSTGLSQDEENNVFDLLTELFPAMRTNEHESEEWVLEQRAVSPSYFERYFSYCILKGDLSDVQFKAFLEEVRSKDINQIITHAKRLFLESSPYTFIIKLSTWKDKLTEDEAFKICRVLASLNEDLPNGRSIFAFGMDGAWLQAVTFICSVLKKFSKNSESLSLELLKPIYPIEFSLQILKTLIKWDKGWEQFLSVTHLKSLKTTFLNRVKHEAGISPIFAVFPESSRDIYELWQSEKPNELNNSLTSYFHENPEKVRDFLYELTITVRSSEVEGEFKANFEERDYKLVSSLVDTELLHSIIKSHFGNEVYKEGQRILGAEPNTHVNVLRQFEYWYTKKNAMN